MLTASLPFLFRMVRLCEGSYSWPLRCLIANQVAELCGVGISELHQLIPGLAQLA
jgi:hypothetical protein